MTNIEHYWDTWNSSTSKYTSVPILGAMCSYDPYKLLKTQTQPRFALLIRLRLGIFASLRFYAKNSGNNNWALQRTPESPLERGRCRATAIQGVACMNDAWGKRTSLGTTTYGWDAMLGLKTSSTFYTQGVLQGSETFGYDPQLDHLTSASYNDGLPSAHPPWCEAAGNQTVSLSCAASS